MSDKATELTEAKQRGLANLKPFQPGQSGNPAGRPVGSRAKLDQAFVDALYEDFKTGGVEAIKACREQKPDVYINVVAKVIPKQVDVKADDALADLASGLQAVASFLEQVAAEASGADHAGPVSDGFVLPADARPQAH
jgi:hypothetical protein